MPQYKAVAYVGEAHTHTVGGDTIQGEARNRNEFVKYVDRVGEPATLYSIYRKLPNGEYGFHSSHRTTAVHQEHAPKLMVRFTVADAAMAAGPDDFTKRLVDSWLNGCTVRIVLSDGTTAYVDLTYVKERD